MIGVLVRGKKVGKYRIRVRSWHLRHVVASYPSNAPDGAGTFVCRWHAAAHASKPNATRLAQASPKNRSGLNESGVVIDPYTLCGSGIREQACASKESAIARCSAVPAGMSQKTLESIPDCVGFSRPISNGSDSWHGTGL